ncbi:MAG: L-dopachrome tautomerase-related protein [Myxococcota bacterium]|nr:L-dopachrome tautomerase-related protein [Myxococcota bacterium]
MARALIAGVALLAAALLGFRLAFGGGEPYPDVSTPPVVRDVEVAATVDLPPGCVTVTPEGRVFFDTHPFAAPGRFGEPHVFELVDGKPVPWPSEAAQELFVAPFGITADRNGRLFLTEPATLDRPATRLLGFDVASGELIFEHVLPDGDARFAQDLRVSPDGRYLILADTGAFNFTPGQLIVLDIETREVIRTLRHESFDPQPWFIRRYDGEPHKVGFGLLTFQVGIDGISFSPDGRWLYYGTMSHDTLYRVPSALLLDPDASDDTVLAAIEPVGTKPQSDGIATTADGRILLTDVENGGIAELTPDGRLRTLTASDDVVWADSIEVAPDGSAYFTDSAIPAYLQQTLVPPEREVLDAAGPYRLYRFRVPPAQAP